jgi:hypothetical protein
LLILSNEPAESIIVHLSRLQKFSLVLLTLLTLLFIGRKGIMAGDFDEYVLMTVAVANHVTPEIRSQDIVRAKQLLPQHAARFDGLAEGMQTQAPIPKYGYYRASNGEVFASHFFAYSALAAIPYRLFEQIGITPSDSFYFLNLACIFILGICLYRFFDNGWKAAFGLLLFASCGGLNYVLWSSPECMSAALLCAGLILFTLESPIIAGMLIGLASTQNPPIVFALGFAPLFKLTLSDQLNTSFVSRLRTVFTKRMLLGLLLGSCLFLAPIVFNYWAFGVHSVIARDSTSTAFISWIRLHSYFFDLSQGMIIGALGIWLGLAWHVLTSTQAEKWRSLFLVILACGLSCIFALTSLVAGNWNSAAIGMMRYAFWGAMPFLFVFLVLLRQQTAWNRPLLLACLLIQTLGVVSAIQYRYLDHSPLAKLILSHSPGLYNPEIEIFAERSRHQDGITLDKNSYYTFDQQGQHHKILAHRDNKLLAVQVCGAQKIDLSALPTNDAGNGWIYINGPIRCDAPH